jgi:hypothetical protein
MTLEAYIEANAASFPNRESRESLKKFAECIPALPLIAQHYLELRGDLFDPKIDMKGISQEQALEGSWAAILLPANRNLILHSIYKKTYVVMMKTITGMLNYFFISDRFANQLKAKTIRTGCGNQLNT